MFITQDILGVYVWFAFINVDHIIPSRRVDLGIILISPIAIAEQSFCDHGPWIGMQKDTAIFLRAGRISGYASQPGIVTVKTWSAQLYAIFGIEPFVNRVHGLYTVLRRSEA